MVFLKFEPGLMGPGGPISSPSPSKSNAEKKIGPLPNIGPSFHGRANTEPSLGEEFGNGNGEDGRFHSS